MNDREKLGVSGGNCRVFNNKDQEGRQKVSGEFEIFAQGFSLTMPKGVTFKKGGGR
jgi:hypothetical protein